MPSVERSIDLEVDPSRAFAACLELLRRPDPRQGMRDRRCEPWPPRVGACVVTTTAGGRELRSEVTVLEPGRRLATESRDGPAVVTELRVVPRGSGARVTLRSDAGAGFDSWRGGGLLERLLFGRAQRRAARATLARLRTSVEA